MAGFGRSPAKRRPPTYLSEAERDRLLAVVEDLRDRAILTLFCFAGLRLNELVMLDREDVDFDRARVLVRFAKGGKWRKLGLHPRAADAIRAYLATRYDDAPALFLSRQGSTRLDKRDAGHKRRLGHQAIQLMLDRYTARVDLRGKHVTPHCLRHTFATALYRQTVDLQLVQRALGHNDIKTTLIYAWLEDDQLAGGMVAMR